MALVNEIETIETAFYVGKRRPLSDLPAWKRLIIRWSYFVTGWCTGDAVEAQGIYTSRESAECAASKPGWFLHELPINVSLPDEMCRFRVHTFPTSDAAPRYERRSVPVGAVKVSDLREGLRIAQDINKAITEASRPI